MPSQPETTVDAANGVPQPKTRPRRQIDRRMSAEKALLAAASSLVARRGVDQTSVADIGLEAGYSRGIVNHRFGSKTKLLQDLARTSQESVEQIFHDAETNKLDSLLTLTRTYLDWLDVSSESPRAFFAMWGAAVPDESVLQSVFTGFDNRFRYRIEGMIRAGHKNGTVAEGADAVGVAIVFVAMLRGIGMQAMVAPDDVDLNAALGACERFLRNTLSP